MKDDKKDAIVPYKKPEISEDIAKLLLQTVTLTKKDFYTVGGKTVSGARALQWDANRKKISTKLVDWGSDNQRAYACVAGWFGDEKTPVGYKEALVEIVYEIERNKFILDKAIKNGWEIKRNSDYVPHFVKDMHNSELYAYMLNKRKFGIRTAITQAEAIIYRKLLSMEFREKEEIEFEKEEIDAVQQQMQIQKGKLPTHANPTPSEKDGRENVSTDDIHDLRREAQPPKGGMVHELTDKGKSVADFIERFEEFETLTQKRDILVKIIQHEEIPLHKQLKMLLGGRDILNLTEKEIDGIIGIFLMEAEKGK